jgi:hypothetical protein
MSFSNNITSLAFLGFGFRNFRKFLVVKIDEEPFMAFNSNALAFNSNARTCCSDESFMGLKTTKYIRLDFILVVIFRLVR